MNTNRRHGLTVNRQGRRLTPCLKLQEVDMMDDIYKIINLRILLRKLVQYDSHSPFEHDLVREEKACDHCKLNKKITKELWEA